MRKLKNIEIQCANKGSRKCIRNIHIILYILNRDFLGFFYFILCLLSTRLDLPPLIFHWVGGCWDRFFKTQAVAKYCDVTRKGGDADRGGKAIDLTSKR
jgi:hypothetical protein